MPRANPNAPSRSAVNAYLEPRMHEAQTTRDAVARDFGGLDAEALNWKPEPDRWSIAQCLDHLIRSNERYWPTFEAVAEGRKQDTLIERIPLLPRAFGPLVRWAIKPDTRMRVPTTRRLQPDASDIPATIVRNFVANVDEHVARIEAMAHLDHRTVVVTSPFASFVCYTLEDAVIISISHLERHRRQALQVRSAWERRGSR